jgi:hypothetical protein
MKDLVDVMVRRVWGPDSPYGDNINYGGPSCAKESSFEWKLGVNLVALPFEILIFWYLLDSADKQFRVRYARLKAQNNLNPNMWEILLGLCYVAIIFGNLYTKYEEETMIFMLNPCHMVANTQLLLAFLPFNSFTNLVAIVSFAFSFGAWIGVLFTENEGLSMT